MFPVWFMSYRNGDRVAYATVNGQTGKVVTDLPVDAKKYTIGSLLLALPIFLFLNLFFTITPTALLITSLVLALIALLAFCAELSNIMERDSGENDRGRKQKQTPEKIKLMGTYVTLAAMAVSLLILFLKPVSDIYYYAGVIFTLCSIFLTVKDLIYYYNILATRRLPQFDRTGGDDRA